ncbi:MAG TPA: PqqD family protein [Vicinamibacterales bacterium]|nr:PqqD family protein [Vicinamibacterales bacterium]
MKRKRDVISRPFGDAAVLVDLTTNQIFELNRTGYRIWELLEERLDRAAITDMLQREFQVERSQLELEVDELLNELRRENLLAEEDDSASPDG